MESAKPVRRSKRLAEKRSRSASPKRAARTRPRSSSAGRLRKQTTAKEIVVAKDTPEVPPVDIGSLTLSSDSGFEVYADEPQAQGTGTVDQPSPRTPLKGENRSRTALTRAATNDNAPRPTPGLGPKKLLAMRNEKNQKKRQKKAEAKHRLQHDGIEIFERLFLGGKGAARNGHVLSKRNVRSIVNVTNDIPCYFEGESDDIHSPSFISYHRVRVNDEQEEEIHKYFDAAVDFIQESLDGSRSFGADDGQLPAVLVHCRMGQSRSATIMYAYAMKKLGWSLRKTNAYMHSKHSNLKINAGFERQLMKYERDLTGSTTFDFHRRKRKVVDYNLERTWVLSSSADIMKGSPIKTMR